MSVQIYGNAPAGEHYARYVSNTNTKYPKGLRLIIGFGLCCEDGSEVLYGADGEPLTAVIVANVPKGDNPKSVAHKVRKAMLTAQTFLCVSLNAHYRRIIQFKPNGGKCHEIVEFRRCGFIYRHSRMYCRRSA